jgi:transcriptional regulator with XRE-family HTH domain
MSEITFRGETKLVLPKLEKITENLGTNIRLARLRRKLSMVQVAERANVSFETYSKIEDGDSSIALAAYVNVMFIFGLETEFANIGFEDKIGRKIQDVNLLSAEYNDMIE